MPTKYYQTPTQKFKDAGITNIIWANHSLRASIEAIKRVTAIIKANESVIPIEHEIANLDDVFSLTNEYEAQQAEEKYSHVE